MIASFVTSLALLSPTISSSQLLVLTEEICDWDSFDSQAKFEYLWEAAFARDFRAFRTVNGDESYNRAPQFVTAYDSNIGIEVAYADFSGLSRADKTAPVVSAWSEIYRIDGEKGRSARVFYAKVERVAWNEYADEYQEWTRHYYVHFDAECRLDLIFQTRFPRWVENL